MCPIISDTWLAFKDYTPNFTMLRLRLFALPCHPSVEVLKSTCENLIGLDDVLTAANNIVECALLSLTLGSHAKTVSAML